MEVVAGYLVVIFFISQFVNLFNWTNLGVILAVNGADFLRGLHLGPVRSSSASCCSPPASIS